MSIAETVQAELGRIDSELRQRLDGFERRQDELATAFQRTAAGGGGANPVPSIEERAFGGFLRRGEAALAPDERKALTVADDTSGGYLAPPQFEGEIIKGLAALSALRRLARVYEAGAESLILPRRTRRAAAQWVGEVQQRPEDQPSFGQHTIVPGELAVIVPVSTKLTEDAAFDLQQLLADDAAEEFAEKEGEAFVSGNGVNKPRGFLTRVDDGTDDAIESIPSGEADGFTADSLLAVLYALHPGYRRNATWLMSGSSMRRVAELKGLDGQYIWREGLAQGQPPTLLGLPVAQDDAMPDVAAGAYPIAFGDWRRGYAIADRVGLSTLRDPYTLAGVGQVRYLFRRRVGADVRQPEAIRVLKIGAA